MPKKKIPVLISDSISTGQIKRRRSIFKETKEEDFLGGNFPDEIDRSRFSFVKLAVLLISAIFLVRIFQLAVIEGKKNRDLADQNRIRLVDVEAVRGKIFDRNGRILAYSEERLFLIKDDKKTLISDEQAKALESEGLAGENFTGLLGRVSREVVRVYPLGEEFAHVLGYVSSVQEEDLKNNPQLSGEKFVGRLGVEETYDQVLRGAKGKKLIEVDASGKTISILGEVAAKDGQDIHLTIDSSLQEKAFDAMKKGLEKSKTNSGALIISSPQNGETLTLLSFPGFDPLDIGRYVAKEDKPLFNRAIGGNYPPGSVFKLASSLAGLESGKITKDTEIEDVGVFELGGVKFPNWYYLASGGREGILKIDRAIARSNDIFFYRLGEVVGLDEIRKWAIKMGLGQKTGVDLPGESFGLVPDEDWKINNLGESWYLGDTMHLAIGQGFLITTPLQVNVMTSYIANGGRKVVPHLVAKVQANGKSIVVGDPEGSGESASSLNIDLIKKGMREACVEKGTAWPFFTVEDYEVACKTGTAEKSQGNPHAWFTAFAPLTLPEVAITVIIENGGEGSSVAAPIAREILDWYFLKK